MNSGMNFGPSEVHLLPTWKRFLSYQASLSNKCCIIPLLMLPMINQLEIEFYWQNREELQHDYTGQTNITILEYWNKPSWAM